MKKYWEQIQKVAARNALFLDKQPDDFLDTDVRLAEKDLLLLLWLLIDDFETEDGRIKKSNKNFLLITRVDELFKGFAIDGGYVLIQNLINRFQKVVSYNTGYFTSLLGKSEQLSLTINRVNTLTNKRLGLNTDGGLVKDGYLHSLYTDNTVRNQSREILYRGVLSQNKPTDLKNEVKKFVMGAEDKGGAIYKFYSKFAYDTFGQIDRMASLQFAEEYKLKWFVYYGTLIKTSRPFCRKHINGIYNTTEAQKWVYEQPAPVGVSATTYNPVIDMGGINCCHTAIFLSNEMAEDLFSRGYSSVPSNL